MQPSWASDTFMKNIKNSYWIQPVYIKFSETLLYTGKKHLKQF